MVPGVAYMRFIVHGGNLQSDNVLQIRIRQPGSSTADTQTGPHLTSAQYEPKALATPSLANLVNGTLNQSSLSQCLTTGTPQDMCEAESLDVSGVTAYSVGTGAQSPIITVAGPLTNAPPQSQKVCVKKVLYQPTDLFPDRQARTRKDQIANSSDPTRLLNESLGLCIYLAVVTDDGQSCSGSSTAVVPPREKLNWVQDFTRTFSYNRQACALHSCVDGGPGPLYRPGATNDIFVDGGPDFGSWRDSLAPLGSLQLIFRDIPQQLIKNDKNADAIVRQFQWTTAPALNPKSTLDNHLRLVSYKEGQESAYTPLIEISYGFHFSIRRDAIVLDQLIIGGHSDGPARTGSISYLRSNARALPSACTNTDPEQLGKPPEP